MTSSPAAPSARASSSGAAPVDVAATTTAAAGAVGQSPHITKDNIDTFDYFQLFGLVRPAAGATPDIDVAAVRRVYRRLSLRFHPDKDDSDEARHAFEVVHTALETIIDAVKLAAYVKSQAEAAASPSAAGAGHGSEEAVRQRQRAQQAQDEAQLAADQLAQRAQERVAREAAARQAAQEREEAAQRLLAELTGSLHTPFQQMEAELVREWDVDAEMVATKTAEVLKLLRQLAPAEGGDEQAWKAGRGVWGAHVMLHEETTRKRGREASV